MEIVSTTETSVSFYYITRRSIRDGTNLQLPDATFDCLRSHILSILHINVGLHDKTTFYRERRV
jgi:hypothetical protein